MNKFIGNYYHITEQLEDWAQGLPELMVSCDTDLTKFHLVFDETMDYSAAMVKLTFQKYLRQSYKVCKDLKFRKDKKHKKQGYDDDYSNNFIITEKLMR